jgi:hypothetical protein
MFSARRSQRTVVETTLWWMAIIALATVALLVVRSRPVGGIDAPDSTSDRPVAAETARSF